MTNNAEVNFLSLVRDLADRASHAVLTSGTQSIVNSDERGNGLSDEPLLRRGTGVASLALECRGETAQRTRRLALRFQATANVRAFPIDP
jgi:hypothetical protein